MSEIAKLEPTLSQLGNALNSPAIELARSASLSISGLLQTVRPMSEMTAQIADISQTWKDEMAPMRTLLDSIAASEIALGARLAQISEVTLLAQASLSTFPWEEVGSVLRITGELRASLSSSYLDFSRSYSQLFQSLEELPLGVLSFPPVVSELPATEFFNASDLLKTISTEEPDRELPEQEERAREEILEETEGALETLLANLDGGLVELWHGANQALVSDNPDRIRHFTTSLRELFTHILHQLAPDDKVRAWSTAPGHFSDGRPTRRARLLFVCKPVDHGPFHQFVDKDVAAVLEILDLFQRGTHEMTTPFSQAQLAALKVRMESAIRLMLELSQFDT